MPSNKLAGLKDFQRQTVEYVFKRFYGDDSTSHFLIADEVGLGKRLLLEYHRQNLGASSR